MEWLFALLTISLLVWGVVLFNRLVRARNLVKAGFADVDVQLQRRHDLVPRLVEVVKGQIGYERGLLDDVMAARTAARQAEQSGQPALMDRPEATLAAALGRMMLLAEDYPELKTSQAFIELGAELVATEDLLSHARRFYNGAVRQLNTRVQQFPDLLVARLFGFKEADFFSAAIEARTVPAVGRLLGERESGST